MVVSGSPPTGPGVEFHCKMSVAAGYSPGKWGFVQIITDGSIISRTTSCTKQDFSGTDILDTSFPYNGTFKADNKNHTMFDSPASILKHPRTGVNRDESFRTIVMFKSDRANSNWVPIRHERFKWRIQYCLTRSGTSWTVESSTYTPPSTLPGCSFPIWDKNISQVPASSITCPNPFCD